MHFRYRRIRYRSIHFYVNDRQFVRSQNFIRCKCTFVIGAFVIGTFYCNLFEYNYLIQNKICVLKLFSTGTKQPVMCKCQLWLQWICHSRNKNNDDTRNRIPVKSQNLGPMYICIFWCLKVALGKRLPKTLQGLWKFVNEEWNNLSLSVLKQSLLSWKYRCCSVHKYIYALDRTL